MGLKDFKERILNDGEYAKKFENIHSVEELVEIASKDGYIFSVEDYENNSELTDAELEAAAGGKYNLSKSNFVPSKSFLDRIHSDKK